MATAAVRSPEIPRGSNPSQEAGSTGSEFLDKMSKIPTVHTVKEYSTQVYNLVKGYNQLTDAALSAAEKTVLYLAVTAKPFLEKVEPQAKALDQAALKGLESIEQNAPFIMKPTEELVSEARVLVGGARDLVSSKVSDVKNFSYHKVNSVLDHTENLVDKYLPPAFGDGAHEASTDNESVKQRTTNLTTKVALRLYGHSVKPFMSLHYLSEVSISKVSYAVTLLMQLKQNVASKSLQENLDDVKVNALWIYEELIKEPVDSPDASLEQRLLQMGRRMMAVVIHSYNVLPTTNLPELYQHHARNAYKLAVEIFTQLDQKSNASEITMSWLESIRQNIASLENLVQNLKAQEEQMEMEQLAAEDAPQQ